MSNIILVSDPPINPNPLRWKIPDSECGAEETRDHVADLLSEMHNLNGLGLAANQLGIKERIFVTEFMVAMNPTIVQAQYYKDVVEGCLSLPGITVTVGRAKKIRVNYFDIVDWDEKSNVFVDEQAHIIQHEIDHLNGVLCIDYGHNVLTGRT